MPDIMELVRPRRGILAIGFVLQIAFAAPLVASEVIGTSMGIGFAFGISGSRYQEPSRDRMRPRLRGKMGSRTIDYKVHFRNG